jgi:CheY-like chemotaxis protein
MTTALLTLKLSLPIPDADKKKRVLLVDASSPKRDLRAQVMRRLGMNVDCAADIPEARSWWRANLYDLVLINMERGLGHRDRFCDDIRSATPPQRLAFLVGKPEYLASLPNADEELLIEDFESQDVAGDVKAALSAHLENLPERWGILEASRRISAVRSASNARTQAMRDRPVQPRDLEARYAEPAPTQSRNLDDLLRKEMQ